MTDDSPHGGFPKFIRATPPPDYGRLIEALRTVQDLAVSTDLPDDQLALAADQAEKLAATMAPYVVPEGLSPAGRALELPGRGSLLMLPWTIEKYGAEGVRSTGVFRRFHLGGNGAAHGGTLPLLFDDLFGLIQHAYGRPISRTAFLHIDYRAVTPLNEQLVAEGHVTKVEGRKTFIEARLTKQDGTLVAESNALMVQLLPGQQ
ncbi:PaaI family thioesterase [Rhodococcus sp. BP-149]|uniref:PaaI family thioesterase n=1 Tax=unclassified Rhodococcus (in: high G+C Gram-positive bacteria) TaxID=192944 RepID=UPI001C9B0557|nr:MULTISPECIES: PaaI family thioesterase [unclassified Rhodococcus (in: high G+C Gram-positive bacteria)]MBY6684987.1 PaaI family thioesterase [Rhodococcus sp. BP-288]MBY6692529.1 PaaI family thioesterase [Rhodococcus sp. BP-188]MBY6698427.1 PaaI family thioesterase [Rhodococcus sp. BP-285]MBY6701106.1 PaaI family thioesterase [Rhodococcus sp. BP-283]MBY6712107.1 PaaI family thioesterase [Rhodococcus sp. BP-160]